jgi:hypothetical protein
MPSAKEWADEAKVLSSAQNRGSGLYPSEYKCCIQPIELMVLMLTQLTKMLKCLETGAG